MYLLRFAPHENSNQPAHPHSLIIVFVVRRKKLCILAIQIAPNEDSGPTARMLTDLNPVWMHMSEGTFSDVETYYYDSYASKSRISAILTVFTCF